MFECSGAATGGGVAKHVQHVSTSIPTTSSWVHSRRAYRCSSKMAVVPVKFMHATDGTAHQPVVIAVHEKMTSAQLQSEVGSMLHRGTETLLVSCEGVAYSFDTVLVQSRAVLSGQLEKSLEYDIALKREQDSKVPKVTKRGKQPAKLWQTAGARKCPTFMPHQNGLSSPYHTVILTRHFNYFVAHVKGILPSVNCGSKTTVVAAFTSNCLTETWSQSVRTSVKLGVLTYC